MSGSLSAGFLNVAASVTICEGIPMKFFGSLVAVVLLLAGQSWGEDAVAPPASKNTSGAWFRAKQAMYVKLTEAGAPYFPVVPISGRRQMNFFTPEEENKLGERSMVEMKAVRKDSADAMFVAQVYRVARHVTSAVKDSAWKWGFAVFEDNEVNAVCMPGGKIGVNTGLMSFVNSDGELAFVISHEVGHAIARHSGEAMSRRVLEKSGLDVLRDALTEFAQKKGKLAPETVTTIIKSADIGTTFLVSLPYGRQQEVEADHLGMLLMARAGYDPADAIKLWTRLRARNGQPDSAIDQYLSTHPADAERIKNMKEWLPDAITEYDKAKAGRSGAPPAGARDQAP